ncbi:uncharacterized protein LOC119736939 [Patiria miniata]|uniref:MYND-type domain-containing protein n=1 Tax=Patiria miniata TaxID=46514 RepID=A0A914ATU1_PATMI|nr:uncharacterized protein LOC119736939 [Patiria miniata]
MDVQPGHCWRCEEKILPEHTVPCSRCPMAVYCSTLCRDKDSIRHSAMECEIYGDKKCSACDKLGKLLECSACNSAWYCNADCQRRDFPLHKTTCRGILTSIKQLSSKLFRLKGQYGDFPEYFGNTLARDFLQLDNNEWSGKSVEEKLELDRDYHVLSAGCGDLRSTVLTAASLPAEYQGKLHVTLNDRDPFVLARNVLFLFMLVRFADTDYISSSLTTIWYSLHISKKEYDLVKTSLDELIQMSAQQLSDATRGLVSVLNEELGYLGHVWRGWQSLECRRGNPASINLRQQRQEMFENSDQELKVERSVYLTCLNANDRKQMKKWFAHGLFLSCEANQRDIPFDNPTLTAQEASKRIAAYGCVQLLQISSEMPKYLISSKRMPFSVWDCLRVREHTPGSHTSPMVMYHKYVTNLLQKVKSLILQGRLLSYVSLANCLDFPNHHQALNMPSYDRIFTSNLADFHGFAKLLQIFKPLLNTNNSFSVIVTEIVGLYINVPTADPWKLPEPQFQKVISNYSRDWPTTKAEYHYIFEYYNSTPPFLQFLRADIMAGECGTPPLQDAPSFESVKKCQGMRMRDFRKELNKLVPLRCRLDVRNLSLVNVGCRAVEWLLPKTES